MGSAARVSKRTCPRCNKVFEDDAAFCPNDGAPLEPRGEPPPDSDRYIGTVIHGDIEIRAVAGAGAMGRVYRAHQRGVDRDVAVKILHRELSGNHTLVQRFHREARIASKLQHPHVVEVFLAGQLPDGALYIVMEFLDGMSLASALQSCGGTLPLERAVPILLQICDAVGEGHSRGIVHRDLKPENVMLVRRADTSDWVKVLDFGIAKVSLGEQSMETAAGAIFGTARYISPEGAQGATVGPAGDVYSIAVIFYQLLAGRTPFDAEQPVGLLIKHIHDEPPPLRSWPTAAAVPESIERVIMDNLAKDPARRAPSARALGNAIASAAREANISFSDVGVVARMSMIDAGLARSAGSSPSSGDLRPPIDPTLDDVAVPPVPRSRSATAPLPNVGPPPPLASGTRATNGADALADTTADGEPLVKRTSAPISVAPPSSDRGHRRRTSTVLVVVAFLLGVALTALATQYLSRRQDAERVAHVQRARHALAAGRYVEPPGDNVRDLVRSGIARWPDDSDLAKIQSDAAHEIVTRAMAARSVGDIGAARDLAKTAQELDPTDATAKLLLTQYEDELAVAESGGQLAGPRVTLEVPIGRARPAGRAELVARVFVGAHAPNVERSEFLVTGPGLPPSGLVLAATERVEPRTPPVQGREGGTPRAPIAYHASFSPPREGRYEIEFEANVDGASVRAQRSLDVTQ